MELKKYQERVLNDLDSYANLYDSLNNPSNSFSSFLLERISISTLISYIFLTMIFFADSTSQSVKNIKSMSVLYSAEARHILYCGGKVPKWGKKTMTFFI